MLQIVGAGAVHSGQRGAKKGDIRDCQRGTLAEVHTLSSCAKTMWDVAEMNQRYLWLRRSVWSNLIVARWLMTGLAMLKGRIGLN